MREYSQPQSRPALGSLQEQMHLESVARQQPAPLLGSLGVRRVTCQPVPEGSSHLT